MKAVRALRFGETRVAGAVCGCGCRGNGTSEYASDQADETRLGNLLEGRQKEHPAVAGGVRNVTDRESDRPTNRLRIADTLDA